MPIETVGKPPESWNANKSQVHNSADFSVVAIDNHSGNTGAVDW